MLYEAIREAVFLERPNRFIALVELDGKVIRAHVKNTGRCRELLLPGTTVFVQKSNNPNRKTAYSLIAVQKGTRLINMDSQAPNVVWAEFLDTSPVLCGFGKLHRYKREVAFGTSRLDFWFASASGVGYMEIKGCTLEEDGIARFPDAPTLRGTRHLYELKAAVEQGLDAAVVFVIQMEDIRWFEPNWRTDPDFAQALRQAADAGVKVLAYTCQVTPHSLLCGQPVPVHIITGDE